MSIESTREVMERYLNSDHGVEVLADDAVFTVMGTGQNHNGPQQIEEMLHYFYHVAFDAVAESTNLIIADGQCCLEANFKGTHIGEFAGVPATGKEVNVPLCVIYDLQDEQIKRVRVYFEVPVFMAQVGAMPA